MLLSKKDLNLHDSAHVVKFNQVLPMSRGELKYPNWKYQNEFGYRISQVESFSVLPSSNFGLLVLFKNLLPFLVGTGTHCTGTYLYLLT